MSEQQQQQLQSTSGVGGSWPGGKNDRETALTTKERESLGVSCVIIILPPDKSLHNTP